MMLVGSSESPGGQKKDTRFESAASKDKRRTMSKERPKTVRAVFKERT